MIKNKKYVENFIIENAAIMTVAAMARKTKVSSATINRIMKRLNIKKRRIFSRMINNKRYNPNTPTATTYMLVCRYNYEGLSIPQIANVLNRTPYEIDFILSECIKNNDYWKFNYYNRTDEEKEIIRLRETENAKKVVNF